MNITENKFGLLCMTDICKIFCVATPCVKADTDWFISTGRTNPSLPLKCKNYQYYYQICGQLCTVWVNLIQKSTNTVKQGRRFTVAFKDSSLDESNVWWNVLLILY